MANIHGADDPAMAEQRRQWEADHGLRKSEFELKREESNRSRWLNPFYIAIFAAALAAGANAWVAKMNNDQQAQLERDRAEAARILEVIKTNDPEKSAANLKFLREVGLVSEDRLRTGLDKYLAAVKPAQVASLPVVVDRGPTAPGTDWTQLATGMIRCYQGNRAAVLAIQEAAVAKDPGKAAAIYRGCANVIGDRLKYANAATAQQWIDAVVHAAACYSPDTGIDSPRVRTEGQVFASPVGPITCIR